METRKNCIAEIIHHIATILGFSLQGIISCRRERRLFVKFFFLYTWQRRDMES